MKQGDFTNLAKDYINRPGYSLDVLRMIARTAGMDRKDFLVADVGAGTGKLTENLEVILLQFGTREILWVMNYMKKLKQ